MESIKFKKILFGFFTGIFFFYTTTAFAVIAQVTGSATPTDSLSNPTNSSPVTSFNMGWNGAVWQRFLNGADNSTNPSYGKAFSLVGRANAAPPTWGEGNAVPLSTDLFGNLRTRISSSTFAPSFANAASIQVITGTSAQIKIYGVTVTQRSVSPGIINLSYGTGTTCGTGPVNVIPFGQTNGFFTINNIMPIVTIPPNQNVCFMLTGGTTPAYDAVITYIQE